MDFQYSDGGRKAAGYKGDADDCFCRAVAVATGKTYKKVYNTINAVAKAKKGRYRSSARDGCYVEIMRLVMKKLGWRWVSLCRVGVGCSTRVRQDELPREGAYILRLAGHIVAYINGVLYDTSDWARENAPFVYGYWTAK